MVDGPVGSVAGPVGEVMTLVPGVKVTVVEKPGPVMVSTVDSVTVTVTTEPPGPVGFSRWAGWLSSWTGWGGDDIGTWS